MGCADETQGLPPGTIGHGSLLGGGAPETPVECHLQCRDVACCGPDGSCVETVQSFCEPYTSGYREGVYPTPIPGGPYSTLAPCDSDSCPTCLSSTKNLSWQTDVTAEVYFVSPYASQQGSTVAVRVSNRSVGGGVAEVSASLYLDTSRQGWIASSRMPPTSGAFIGSHPATWSDGTMPTEPGRTTFSGYRATSDYFSAQIDCSGTAPWSYYQGQTWGVFGAPFRITSENQIRYYRRTINFAVKVGYIVIDDATPVPNGSYIVGTHDIYLHGSGGGWGQFVNRNFAATETFPGSSYVDFRADLPSGSPQSQQNEFFLSPLIFEGSSYTTCDLRISLLAAANPLP